MHTAKLAVDIAIRQKREDFLRVLSMAREAQPGTAFAPASYLFSTAYFAY
jgi:hypothetical protein